MIKYKGDMLQNAFHTGVGDYCKGRTFIQRLELNEKFKTEEDGKIDFTDKDVLKEYNRGIELGPTYKLSMNK